MVVDDNPQELNREQLAGKDKDEQILEFIRKNPLAREREIGKAIKLSRTAVHNRLTRLRKMQHVRSGMTVNLNALGFKHRYRVDIRIDPWRLKDAVKKDGELWKTSNEWPSTNAQQVLAFHILNMGKDDPNLIVEDVQVILGDPADLCAIVRLKNAELIYPFVTEKLRMLHSVSGTSTCIEAWSCSLEMQKHLLQERPKRVRKAKQVTATV